MTSIDVQVCSRSKQIPWYPWCIEDGKKILTNRPRCYRIFAQESRGFGQGRASFQHGYTVFSTRTSFDCRARKSINICSTFFLICRGSFGPPAGGRVDVHVLVDHAPRSSHTRNNYGDPQISAPRFSSYAEGHLAHPRGGRVDVHVLVDIMRHAAATPAMTIAAAAFDTSASRPEAASTREPPRT